MGMNQAWFVGECMVELRRAGAGLLAQAFAGDVYNTAVYFARLVDTTRACFVSAVGTDALSDALLDAAAQEHVDTERVTRVVGREPGLYWVETNEQGERSFLYWREQSAARAMLDSGHMERLYAGLDACRLIYFSGITLAILDDGRRGRLLELARAVRRHGGWVAFDSNYRRRLWSGPQAAAQWMDAALDTASHVLVTFEDEAELRGDPDPAATLGRVLARGAAEAVVKRGARGCLAQSSLMGTPLTIPAEAVDVVDTTAAGDAFNAGYLAARLDGADIGKAAELGTRLAGRVIGYPGAIIDAAVMQGLRVF